MPEALWQALEYLKQGGWTMIPLIGFSLLMWMFILERWWSFRRLESSDIKITRAVKAMDEGSYKGVREGLRARLVRDFLERRAGEPDVDRRVLQECTLALRHSLKDRLAAIAVLASVAPLLGLLGTVLGMIETFDVISVFGTGNARAMAGGISVALVTTQSGLIIAIPGLFISGALARRARRLENRLDEVAVILDRHIKLGGPAPSAEVEAT
ncbi:MotA/TolQ/ExbB proton channel family protein [bacterium]|nr:MotA/TolQ/ExbB proton channel family protein [bacterium]HPF35646.1 MotA/TolQ/ExbB proton channel family protein [Candidatus Krumholzibacteria bacterium]HRX51330.1 MotA/TolQ/ExbB proton channel family protein [Candidatus Krumholzibacteria bacterium]